LIQNVLKVVGKFISNNKREYGFGAECPSFSSPITWFVNKEGQFILKVLDAGESKG
jgi:hypothetical protein